MPGERPGFDPELDTSQNLFNDGRLVDGAGIDTVSEPEGNWLDSIDIDTPPSFCAATMKFCARYGQRLADSALGAAWVTADCRDALWINPACGNAVQVAIVRN